jgi:hypothetical protein
MPARDHVSPVMFSGKKKGWIVLFKNGLVDP